MKGVKTRNGKTVFRVNTGFYSRDFVKRVFGDGKEVEEYMVFETKLSESEVYDKFNELLEMMWR
ncbi:MAG: hypothetical protein GOV01_03155 [Candidatus Altiarchaeota archaeon]|nr:hypothetical protein [Candidatus Altiarchaeota archaeon]